MLELAHDFRLAARALLARPGYALAALLTLALGLGATTAVFSALHGYLLRPLPFPDGERLVHVHARIPQFGDMKLGISQPDYLDVRERARSLVAVGIYDGDRVRLGSGPRSERVDVARVTPSLLATLGLPPALGRAFREEEGLPGAGEVALLSHQAWVRRFAADPAVLGRRLQVEGRTVAVVGVMPPSFALPLAERAELLLPLAVDPAVRGGDARGNWNGNTIARLRAGTSVAAAERELAGLWRQLVAEHPEMRFFVDDLGYHVVVETLRDSEVAALRSSLPLLQVAALLVLLVAAANLAGLTLSRLAARARELAVRSALGAGTRRLLRLVLIENLVLALAGGVAGLALGRAALAGVERSGLAPETVLVSLRPDAVVLGLGLLLALATGAAASLAPVWWLRRAALEGVLRAEGRASTGGRSAQRLRAALVVGQVAVSLTLVVLVGLLTASLQRLLAVDTGFASDGVLVGQLTARDEESARRTRDRDALLAAVAAVPGVRGVGLASCVPFAGCAELSSFRLAGRTYGEAEREPTAHHARVSAGYFDALRIPLAAGRFFTAVDLAPPGAVIVDQAFAERWFPGRSPLGERLELGAAGEGAAVIVGVVGRVRAQDLARDDEAPSYYTPSRELADGAYLVARVAAPAGAGAAVRAAVERADPTTTLGSLVWLRDRLRDSVAGRVGPTLLVGSFALLATLLAALGVYAVLALSVARRRVELGVRAALGADRRRLLRMVLAQGVRLLGAGCVLGAALAAAASSLVSSQLFGVGRGEPGVYLAAAGVLAVIGLLACWVPAARAAAVEPTVALRED